MSQVWRGDDEPYDLYVVPEPRGPLTVGEHLLFAFLAVAIIACSAWLALYANGIGR